MTKQHTYTELRRELDELLERFEQVSTTDIDVLLKDYEKAQKLIKQLEAKLTEAQLTIKKISKNQ